MSGITLLTGDCLKILPTLPAESVQCVVTSPPYWGLRSYKTEPQIWLNGHEPCTEHEWDKSSKRKNRADYSISGKQASNKGTLFDAQTDTCSVCGAWRGELGLEPTVQMYVDHLIQIFREVKRVLRRDGTCWVNMGDSYSGSNGGKGDYRKDKSLQRDIYDFEKPQSRFSTELGAKQLVGVPWRFAFAMQADGWILRSDIIWAKTNPMPESVKDRLTKAHEYIFLLAKSERYFYDAEAVKEEAAYDGRKDTVMKGSAKYKDGFVPNQSEQTVHARGHERWQWEDGVAYRNRRSVWTVSSQPYKEGHFAVFPPKLIEPCILAGTSARGVCPKCGAQWRGKRSQ